MSASSSGRGSYSPDPRSLKRALDLHRKLGRVMSESELVFRERPPAADAHGLLVLHHGRGADESDLLALADVLDPERGLHIVTPRAPLQLPGWPGYHWYVVPRVGYPDPETFHAAYRKLAVFHDVLWERTGVAAERTVLGGFSMGSVMSYSLGLGADRPAPAGILAFSGFVPVVEGWKPVLESRRHMRVLIAHGRNDPVMEIGFARSARALLEEADLEVEYHESDVAHQIDPAHIPAARDWLDTTFGFPR
jgi:phospholipase/carboxylesterase